LNSTYFSGFIQLCQAEKRRFCRQCGLLKGTISLIDEKPHYRQQTSLSNVWDRIQQWSTAPV